MLSRIVIPALVAFSAVFSSGFADIYYTISYHEDPYHKIQVEPLKGWSVDDDGDQPFDYKFVNESENKTFYIFTNLEDEDISQSDLTVGTDQIIEGFYGDKTKSNHRISFSPNQFWHSFDVIEQGVPLSVGIVVYSIDHYLFGVVLESRNGQDSLIKDCNAMLQNILLITLNR